MAEHDKETPLKTRKRRKSKTRSKTEPETEAAKPKRTRSKRDRGEKSSAEADAPRAGRSVGTDAASPQTGRSVSAEIWAIVILVAGFLLFLALASFAPERADGNLIGPAGAFFADSLFFLFGVASFCFVGLAFAWGVTLLLDRNLFHRYGEGLGYGLLLVGAAMFLHMTVDARPFGHDAGGIVGGLLGGVLESAIGSMGGIVVTLAGFVVAAMLITEQSLVDLLERFVRSFREGLRAVSQRLFTGYTPALDGPSFDAEPAAVDDAPKASLTARLTGMFRRARVDADPDEATEVSAGRRARVRTSTVPLGEIGDVDEGAMKDEPAWVADLGGTGDYATADELIVGEDAIRSPEVAVRSPASKAAKTPPPAPTAPASETAGAGPVIVESEALKNRKRAEDLDRAQQVALRLDENRGSWDLPPLSFLNYEEQNATDVDKTKLRELAATLERVLADFRVAGKVTGICPGPVVTLFEFEPESGTKLSKISNLSDDIAMALKAHKVRIIAPIPGKGCVGIEVPNDTREVVYLKEILADDVFTTSKSKLTLALGKDIEGFPVSMDLAKCPHLLIAGTTGSGKSVAVNGMITSILYNASPDEVKLILIDPKQLEFALYEGVPHLLLPVVTDPAKAATALHWAVQEMERRYRLMAELKVRNIKGYNEKLRKLRADVAERQEDDDFTPSPLEQAILETDPDGRPTHRRMFYLVVIVDEFADLMMVAGKEVEISVARLAQKARAAGIHVVIATQRPSVDVITGLIKANFPTRISFRLMSGTDSRTVLDTTGAENLLGMGDMLYRPPGRSDLQRIHGAYVDEREIETVVQFVNAQRQPDYDETILAAPDTDGDEFGDEPVDEFYDQAVSVVIEAGFASISMIQRKLRIGYNRSARIVEQMEREGVVGPATGGSSRRDVLVGGAHLGV